MTVSAPLFQVAQFKAGLTADGFADSEEVGVEYGRQAMVYFRSEQKRFANNFLTMPLFYLNTKRSSFLRYFYIFR